jgi:hypothetical protein
VGFDIAHPGKHAAPQVANPEVVLRKNPGYILGSAATLAVEDDLLLHREVEVTFQERRPGHKLGTLDPDDLPLERLTNIQQQKVVLVDPASR